jgi:hypothetical protein
MTEQDFTANTVSIGGLVLSLAEFQTGLTILVLCTALALNIVRIIDIKTRKKKDHKEDAT